MPRQACTDLFKKLLVSFCKIHNTVLSGIIIGRLSEVCKTSEILRVKYSNIFSPKLLFQSYYNAYVYKMLLNVLL